MASDVSNTVLARNIKHSQKKGDGSGSAEICGMIQELPLGLTNLDASWKNRLCLLQDPVALVEESMIRDARSLAHHSQAA
jgi:hypothetical protein